MEIVIIGAVVVIALLVVVRHMNRPDRVETVYFDPAAVEVVGESHYQPELEHFAGGRTEESADVPVVVTLEREPDNEHDRYAVRVAIDGVTVGYLSRRDARESQHAVSGGPLRARGRIVGGWGRGERQGHFGVRLERGNP